VVHFRERGHVYFAYRPKADLGAARDVDDVQRLYMILSPNGKDSFRLLVIGQKRLPVVAGAGDRKAWAFVEKVSSQPEEIEDELDPQTYLGPEGKQRRRPAARPAGEGVYVIVRHRNHTHLAYVLELPARPGAVQRALNIVKEGNYVVTVKNPGAPSPPSAGLDGARRVRFPRGLRTRFRGRRFIPLDPPDFLNHEGAEVLLVGAGQDLASVSGLRPVPEHETEAAAAIFTDLRMEETLHPIRPLLEGTWE
jgi:hypothetical protein